MARTKQPYGTWSSPITASAIAEGIQIPEAAWSPDGLRLVWLEEHSGQGILFTSDLGGDDARRLTGEESVRASVGYGGGNFAVGPEHVYFVERDGRIHAQLPAHGMARPITPPGTLCSSPAVSPDGRWLVYVFEEAGQAGLAVVDGEGRHWPYKVAEGRDFYMHPAWHPDGSALAWVSWDHPRMPWDGSRLFTMPLRDDGEGPRPAGEPLSIAGGDAEAVLQPEYSPDGRWLVYSSDRSGWFQLYRHEPGSEAEPLRLTGEEAEFGGAAWQLGTRWFGWLPGSTELVAVRNRVGTVALMRVDAGGAGCAELVPPGDAYTTIARPVVNPADGRIAAHAASEAIPPRLIVWDAKSGAEGGAVPPRILRRSTGERFHPDDLAPIRPIEWRSEEGAAVHGLFSPPQNARFESDGLPPLVVSIHGGPTSQAYRTWRPDLQFLTSRGYAVLDVNHRGSSGYGRAYREELHEEWGVIDVEDALSGMRYVADQGWADGDRAAIKGGSAGGYTVLRAITTHPEAFRAAVCLYGISDLFALARETHKFEAHYLDSLIGPLPEAADRYRERSPLLSADRIRTPIIIFQGEDDRVVPPSQSEMIVESLRARGVPHEYHRYAGEGHGFRRRETVRACLEAMEIFLMNHLLHG